MSPRNPLVLVLALFALMFLVACGGSGNSVTQATSPPSGGFSNSNLNGTYVFSVSGTDASGTGYAMVGTITADGSGGTGKGNITAGTIDINDTNTSEFTGGPIVGATVSSGSTFAVTVDGRGQTSINTNISGFPAIVLDFVLSDSSHGLVTEFDTFGSGSGTLDLQSSGATASGAYAFSLSGASFASNSALATAGNFTLGSAGALAGLDDYNESGTNAFADQALTGSLVVGPSSTPSTTLTTAGFGTLTFDVFAISATHLKFIEMDTFGTLAGDAFSQSSTTMPVGNLAFTLGGFNQGAPFAAGGFMVTDSAGNITSASTEDYNVDGTPSASTGPFTGSYTAAGTGRYVLDNFATFVGGSSYAAYPSSGGVLLLENDNVGITTGVAYAPQTSGATLAASEGYGLNLSGTNLTNDVEVDDIAEFTANSSGTTLTGVLDENYDPQGSAIYGLNLSPGSNTATYTAPDSNGRGSILAPGIGSSSNSTLNGGFSLIYYTVDGVTFPFIETDSGQVSTGVFVQQSSTASGAAITSRPHTFVPQPLIGAHAKKAKQK